MSAAGAFSDGRRHLAWPGRRPSSAKRLHSFVILDYRSGFELLVATAINCPLSARKRTWQKHRHVRHGPWTDISTHHGRPLRRHPRYRRRRKAMAHYPLARV